MDTDFIKAVVTHDNLVENVQDIMQRIRGLQEKLRNSLEDHSDNVYDIIKTKQLVLCLTRDLDTARKELLAFEASIEDEILKLKKGNKK